MSSRTRQWLAPPAALPVRMERILWWGNAAWLVALVILVAWPTARSGERGWWSSVCGVGLGLGLLGVVVVRRGIGVGPPPDQGESAGD